MSRRREPTIRPGAGPTAAPCGPSRIVEDRPDPSSSLGVTDRMAQVGESAQIVITDYDAHWPSRFRQVAVQLRATLGSDALRVDHIGSTSVPGLAAKDVIDVQITVIRLDVADSWPDELLPGLVRFKDAARDHVPAGLTSVPADWVKRYWTQPAELHVHVREQGRANQRYALLLRDFLRADPVAAGAYAAVKRALADSRQATGTVTTP